MLSREVVEGEGLQQPMDIARLRPARSCSFQFPDPVCDVGRQRTCLDSKHIRKVRGRYVRALVPELFMEFLTRPGAYDLDGNVRIRPQPGHANEMSREI